MRVTKGQLRADATRAADRATDLLYPLIYTAVGMPRRDAVPLDDFYEAFTQVQVDLNRWVDRYMRLGEE